MPARISDWVNLQDYLGLNSDQAADMGQRVYDDVSGKAQKAKTELGNDEQQFGDAVNKGTLQGPAGDTSQYSQQQATTNAQTGYAGPTSLASYDTSLEGDVNKASQSVTAASDPNQLGSVIRETYGSQSASGPGGSALDAFLVGESSGDKLSGLGSKYGSLMSDLGVAEGHAYDQAQAGAKTNATNQQAWNDLAGKKQEAANAPPGAIDDNSSTAKDVHDLLYGSDGKDFFSTMHQAGLSFSPADWAAVAVGESGTDTPMPTEAFVEGATGMIANQMKSSWPAGKFQMAWGMEASKYSSEAMAAMLKEFSKNNKALLHQYLTNMKNPGFMAHNMDIWMQQHGFQPRGAKDNIHETRSLGYGSTYKDSSGQQHTTTDAQESERVIAYRQGWGEAWDRQFNGGNQNPTKP
jgi:hypothetical protein